MSPDRTKEASETLPQIGSSAERILFLHIPKAAGTTLHRIINRQYPAGHIYTVAGDRPQEALEEFLSLPPAEKEPCRVIKGHFPYGIHESVPGPFTYITVLREPFSRICSLYYFAKVLPNHYLHRVIASGNLGIGDFVASGASPELDNAMTKQISGIFTPFGQCTEEHFERAKRNLREHFAVVGLAERFDESLILMKRRFGWTYPFYVPENVTFRRPPQRLIPESERRRFEEFNRFDVELYRYGVALFEEAVRREQPVFDQELRRFRAMNRPLGLARHAFRSVKRLFLPPTEKDFDSRR